MENTVMNNEVVETVVENAAPELPAIMVEDISKHNMVDAVKSLATSTINSFKIIDENEAGFRNEIDDLFNEVGNINGTVSELQKQVKTLRLGVGAGLVLGGIAAIGFGISVLKKKKKDIPVADPVVLQEEVVEGEVVEESEK